MAVFNIDKATIVPFCIYLKLLVFVRIVFVGKLTKLMLKITSLFIGAILIAYRDQ